jgi:hypothetical protein
MNATQAKAAIKKLFGKNGGARYDEGAPKAEEREQLREALPGLSAKAAEAKTALNARREELLRDPEYVRLLAQYHEANTLRDNTMGRMHRHRVTVGFSNGLFFHVMAEGDNWQEAIDNARAKKV